MNKGRIIIISIILLCAMLYCCLTKFSISLKQDNIDKNHSYDYEYVYSTLNRNILDHKLLKLSINLEKDVYDFSEKVKGEFIPMLNRNISFPPELITMFEQAIYDSCNYSPRNVFNKDLEESQYYQVIKGLNSTEYELSLKKIYSLFPELMSCKDEIVDEYDAYKLLSQADNCNNMFYINTGEGKDYYIFVYDLGGSDGVNNVVYTRYINNQFEEICEFKTQNNGYGQVVQYKDNYYYVFLEYNYMLKIYDGVRLHKLGLNAEKENIQIKYLPDEFLWNNYYYNYKKVNLKQSLDNYMNSIRIIIASDKYIQCGTDNETEVFWGDEELVNDDLSDENNSYYKMDFANLGIPIYMTKSMFSPSDYRSTQHLRAKFYIYNDKDNLMQQLENIEVGQYVPNGIELVQLWFKKIEDEILTFRIYHISDYNYILNVSLIEGDKVTNIRTDLILPHREFKLVEDSCN